MSMREGKLTVPLDADLRDFVERTAEREDRTMASWVRHLIAEAARAQSTASSKREAA